MKRSTSNLQQVKNVWETINFKEVLKIENLQQLIDQKYVEFFHVGKFYHYLFDLQAAEFTYMSDSVKDVLGYEREEVSVPFFLELIHPHDFPYFLSFEEKVVEFFNQLPSEKINKYKVRYDYRIRSKSGEYTRILHQMLSIVPDLNVATHTLCFHTDITYLKNEGTPLLSFIGLDGEPSFVDVGNLHDFQPFLPPLSERELDIIKHLAEGLTSVEIAFQLNISAETVKTHRKNILRKMDSNKTVDLIAKVIKEGWL